LTEEVPPNDGANSKGRARRATVLQLPLQPPFSRNSSACRKEAKQVVEAGSAPLQPREGATLTAVDQNLFLIGGVSEEGHTPDQEALCIFSTTQEVWLLKVEVELLTRDPCHDHRSNILPETLFSEAPNILTLFCWSPVHLAFDSWE
jgi:hypothetical protein